MNLCFWEKTKYSMAKVEIIFFICYIFVNFQIVLDVVLLLDIISI